MMTLINSSKLSTSSLVGKVVTTTKKVHFTDGTLHRIGDRHIVSKADEAYFQLFLNKGYTLTK